jgi:hypothetical protein
MNTITTLSCYCKANWPTSVCLLKMYWKFAHRSAPSTFCLVVPETNLSVPKNMKESKDRTEQFMHSTSSAASQAPASQSSCLSSFDPLHYSYGLCSDSVLFNNRADPMSDGSPSRFDPKGKSRANQNGDVLAMNLDAAEEGGAGGPQNGAFMQMQLMEQQASCYLVSGDVVSNNIFVFRTPTYNSVQRQ